MLSNKTLDCLSASLLYLYCRHGMIDTTKCVPCMKGVATMTITERYSMVVPADWVPGPEQGQWTYSNYAALPDDGQRYEIVNGVLVMAPAPSPEHQSIAVRLAYYVFPHVDLAGIGRLFTAPRHFCQRGAALADCVAAAMNRKKNSHLRR